MQTKATIVRNYRQKQALEVFLKTEVKNVPNFE